MVLARRDTVVFEEITEHTLERHQQHRPCDVRGSTRESLSERVLEEFGRLRIHGGLELRLRQLQSCLG